MSTPRTLVIGAGIVGSAAAWDLDRRGHQVTIADARPEVAALVAAATGSDHVVVDASDVPAVTELMGSHDAVVAAVPYSLGPRLAGCAIAAGTHYVDFGGNPSIVKAQLTANEAAREADVAIVPDCGLAPGVANVIAAGLIADLGGHGIDSVQIRVGALPAVPVGILNYQLAFSPGGLINEYAEPCEILTEGRPDTVDPLTRFEQVEWPGREALEAFTTAGGTSTMCQDFTGRVAELEYKTLRYPGHGMIFAALRDLGMFDEKSRHIGDVDVAPRAVLLDALASHLPSGAPDVVLVRVEAVRGDTRLTAEIEDGPDGRFSALARTTAFPATALVDLLVTDRARFRGVAAMHSAVDPAVLLAELAAVDITVRRPA